MNELRNLDVVMFDHTRIIVINPFWCTFSAPKQKIQNLLKMEKITNSEYELGKMVSRYESFKGILGLNFNKTLI